MRAIDPCVPVIMLTARGEVADRVRGLDLGATDYLVKPFAFAELAARIRAHTRQPGQAATCATALEVGESDARPADARGARSTAAMCRSRRASSHCSRI